MSLRIARSYTTQPQATWSYTGIFNNARVGHTATLLPNGKFWSRGAAIMNLTRFDECRVVRSGHRHVELHRNLNNARVGHTATFLLAKRESSVAGATNWDSDFLRKSAEFYDSATESWSITTTLTQSAALVTQQLATAGSCRGLR